MEPFLADLLNNSKAPKLIRYIIVCIICAFIISLGIILALKSPLKLGKIFGIFLSIIFLIIGIYLNVKIYKN